MLISSKLRTMNNVKMKWTAKLNTRAGKLTFPIIYNLILTKVYMKQVVWVHLPETFLMMLSFP